MRLPTAKTLSNSTLVPLWLLLRDFATFAGTKGLKAFFVRLPWRRRRGRGPRAPYSVLLGHHRLAKYRWLGAGCVAWLFTLFSAESRLAKLGVLVASFAMLMVARAVIITVRDVTMAQLQIGFHSADPFADHPPACRSAMGHSLALAPQPYHAPDGRGHSAARERDLHPTARRSCRRHAGEPDCSGLSAGAASGRDWRSALCSWAPRRCSLW